MENVGLFPFVLLLSQAGAKPADMPPNFGAYLRLHPSEAGLAVSAEERTPLKTGSGLARYNRKAVRLGGLTALVPLNMVAFDDSLRQPPNLYDGLPRESKVLYLLSLLRADQVQRAARTGIGLGDLQGEARQVFASLLPKTVRWSKERLGKEAAYGDKVGGGEFTEARILGMRLKVERQLQFEIPLVEHSDSYTFHDASEEHGHPGETVLIRNTDDEFERKETYGVTIQKTVPNVLKHGQLDTSRLDGTVALPTQTTVGKAAALAGQATGREILADLRVRDRKVTSPGGRVRAGDLLDALALAVEGTYRRVGGAFLLVSDVTGLGTRKLRLTVWEQDLDLQLRQKEETWRRALAASGGLTNVGYDEGSGLAPSPEMLKAMAGRSPQDSNKWTSTTEFTPDIRSFLERVNLRYSSQKVDTSRARANWELRYRFVTADGENFQTENAGLGQSISFEGNRSGPARESVAAPKRPLDSTNGVGLALSARTPDEAIAAVAIAKRYGFGELWLDTIREETLRAALATGFPVRLVVRPWASESGTPQVLLDRSILGDTAAQAAARIDRSEATVAAAHGPIRTGWEREPIGKDPTDVIAPEAAILPSRWSTFQALAATPGLRGVAVLATQPQGYEGGAYDGRVGIERQELLDLAAMGYTDEARLAFARTRGVDPIDLADRGLMFSADLRPPFFLDDALRGSSTVYDGSQEPLPAMETLPKEWSTSRAAANEARIQELLRGLPSTTLWIEVRHQGRLTTRNRTRTLQAWTAGAPLPTLPEEGGGYRMNGQTIVQVPESDRDGSQMPFGAIVNLFSQPRKGALTLDLGSLPASDWERRLNRWLLPK